MHYLFVILLLAAIISFVVIFQNRSGIRKSLKTEKYVSPQKKKKPCPICGTMLDSGEKVTSHEYRGASSSVVHVFGCPHCYGDSAHLARMCPICRQEMYSDNYLMGTMTREEKKIFLKIRGCVSCS